MLEKHLSQFKRQKLIANWYDRLIRPGTDWAKEIDTHLNSASIILLLISADFLGSDYCTGIEMKRALERQETGEARVIPIMLRHVYWQGAPFERLQMLPQDARPVATWEDHDLAFTHIAMQLRKVVEELQGSPMNNSHPQEELVKSNNPSNPQSGSTNDNLDQFRHCRKKVSELKSVHNMLHKIEVELGGLSITVQLSEREEQRSSRKRSVSPRKETNQYLPDFKQIEKMWRQVALQLDYLAYFAAEDMKIMEKERFSFGNDEIRGPSWITDLFRLQRSFEIVVRARNIDDIKQSSDELLARCRTHLYLIDQRLQSAVQELDSAASDLMMRNRI
jgi:hypothetical protein